MTLAAGTVLEAAFVGSALLAAFGTAAGSVVRDEVVRFLRTRFGRADLGILIVNLAACVLAGLAASSGELPRAALVLGLAGGLSTWSSLAVEVACDLHARRWSRVALHIPVACAIAIAAYLAARSIAGGLA